MRGYEREKLVEEERKIRQKCIQAGKSGDRDAWDRHGQLANWLGDLLRARAPNPCDHDLCRYHGSTPAKAILGLFNPKALWGMDVLWDEPDYPRPTRARIEKFAESCSGECIGYGEFRPAIDKDGCDTDPVWHLCDCGILLFLVIVELVYAGFSWKNATELVMEHPCLLLEVVAAGLDSTETGGAPPIFQFGQIHSPEHRGGKCRTGTVVQMDMRHFAEYIGRPALEAIWG